MLDGKSIPILIAGLAGSAMALQGTLNSVLGKKVGQVEASFIVHIIGALSLAALLFLFGIGKGDFGKMREAPWYSYLGGPLSVIIIYGVIASIPKVGVATATTAIVTFQILTAAAIDHFGLFGMEPMAFTPLKGLAIVLIAVGARILLC